MSRIFIKSAFISHHFHHLHVISTFQLLEGLRHLSSTQEMCRGSETIRDFFGKNEKFACLAHGFLVNLWL